MHESVVGQRAMRFRPYMGHGSTKPAREQLISLPGPLLRALNYHPADSARAIRASLLMYRDAAMAFLVRPPWAAQQAGMALAHVDLGNSFNEAALSLCSCPTSCMKPTSSIIYPLLKSTTSARFLSSVINNTRSCSNRSNRFFLEYGVFC